MRPLPEWVREGARSLLGLVDRNVPVAELTFDSLLDDGDVADPAAPRRLLFISPSGISIAVSLEGASSLLAGRLEITPPRGYDVAVQHKSLPVVHAVTDQSGLAALPGLNRGLTSLHVSPRGDEDEVGCRTAWVVY